MKRRNFLKYTSRLAATAPILVNGMSVAALPMSSLFTAVNGDSDRVLVLIQLIGGNDGLNTFIPLDQYDKLANARPQVLLPQDQIIGVTDTIGFHPSMTGIKSLYDNARLSVVQGVGYPNQNRSHFRSTDIWNSGSASDEVITTGWLGRNFQRENPTFPDGFPSEECTDPFAVTMGNAASATCQGTSSNFSIAVTDPFNISPLPEGALSTAPATPYGEELSYLRTIIAQSNAYGETVSNAANLGANVVDYPDTNLAQQLKNVALLLSGGSETRVFVCTLGGFDTHANQVVATDTTTGEHAVLLETLSDAIAAFQADLSALNLEERVVGMTYSEFGRRIISNAANGTDHGSAAPLMVFGSCINAGFIGDNAEIPDAPDILDGVAMQYDFRDVFGSILEDWFEVTESDIQEMIKPDYQHIPVINVCDTSVPVREVIDTNIETWAAPNPFHSTTQIYFSSQNEHVRLSIFDLKGTEIKVLLNKKMSSGAHHVSFDGSGLAAGNYFYRLQLESGVQKSKLMVKV
jgi:uncharacterized protein (DUF1501 family)